MLTSRCEMVPAADQGNARRMAKNDGARSQAQSPSAHDDLCPTPDKRAHRSQAAARRFERRRRVPAGAPKRRCYPYLCAGGAHWHLTRKTPAQQGYVAAAIARDLARKDTAA